MSYILESIKKSDKERQSISTALPEVPLHDLTSTPYVLHISPYSGRGYLVALLVLLLLAIGWYQYRNNTNDTNEYGGLPLVHGNNGSHGRDHRYDETLAARAASTPATKLSPTHDARSVATLAIPPVKTPTIVADEELSLYRSLRTQKIHIREIPSDPNTSQISSLYRQQEQQVYDAAEREHVEEKPTIVNEAKETSKQNIDPQLSIITKNKTRLRVVSLPQIPSIYDLPISMSDAIPAIHYQAHIYASDNRRGFVILNWEKLQVGDRVSDGIYVEKVESEGVVLSYNGVVFLLPAMKSWKPTLPIYKE